MPATSFAARLRTLLAEHELSQTELARRMGISRSTISKLVNDRQRPNARHLGAIAHEFGVDLLELMGVPSSFEVRAELEARLAAAQDRAGRVELACAREAAARSDLEHEVAAAQERADLARVREAEARSEAEAKIAEAQRVAEQARAREAEARSKAETEVTEAQRLVEEAKRARSREELGRLRAQASVDHLRERAEQAEQARARAVAARSRVQAKLNKLEARLAEAETARTTAERERDQLSEKLEEAQALIDRLSVVEEPRGFSTRRGSLWPSFILDPRESDASRAATFAGAIVSTVTGIATELLVFNYKTKQLGSGE